MFVGFGARLYRKIVGVPVGAGCAPLVADLFLFCYGRDFVLSLSDNGQTDVNEAFGSTSGCLDDLLGVDGPCFGRVVDRICPTGLRLGGAGSFVAEASF